MPLVSFPSRSSRQAFTLVELLVVMTVIAALVGMTLPILGRARDAARAMVCMSNMRQLGIAAAGYEGDSNGVLPQPDQINPGVVGGAITQRQSGSALWFNALDRYLRQQHKDYERNADERRNYPAFKQDPVWLSFSKRGRHDNRTIKMNDHLGGTAGAGGGARRVRYRRVSGIARASRTVLFGDGRARDLTSSRDPTSSAFFLTEGRVGLRHQGGANIAFVDVSARRVEQPIRTDTAAPSWYREPDSRQTLVWDPDKR